MEMTSRTIKTADKELILSDSLLCAVLSVEAESVGVSLEEYVERFLVEYIKNDGKFIRRISIGTISRKNISKVVDILPIMWYNSTDR